MGNVRRRCSAAPPVDLYAPTKAALSRMAEAQGTNGGPWHESSAVPAVRRGAGGAADRVESLLHGRNVGRRGAGRSGPR